MIKRITYSIKDVSIILGLSYTTVYKMARSNEIPFIKIGGQYLIPTNNFSEWLNAKYKGGNN